MPWKGEPPTVPKARSIEAAVSPIVRDGAEDVRDALAAGSPVDTGALRASWSVTGSGHSFSVQPGVSYAPYQKIDTTAAERVVTETSAEIGARVDRLFKE